MNIIEQKIGTCFLSYKTIKRSGEFSPLNGRDPHLHPVSLFCKNTQYRLRSVIPRWRLKWSLQSE